jgi:hypothetical protein
MTERYTGIPENQKFAGVVPERTHVNLRQLAGNPEVIPGLRQGSLAEAIYDQAFQEKFAAKLDIKRLEVKINLMIKSGQPAEVEEAELRRLKLWVFTFEAIYRAVEPDVLYPKRVEKTATNPLWNRFYRFAGNEKGTDILKTKKQDDKSG